MDFAKFAQEYGLPTAILITGFVGFFVAIIRGDLVPGHIYRERVKREVEITDKSLASNEKGNAAIEKLTTAIEAWRSVERRTGLR